MTSKGSTDDDQLTIVVADVSTPPANSEEVLAFCEMLGEHFGRPELFYKEFNQPRLDSEPEAVRLLREAMKSKVKPEPASEAKDPDVEITGSTYGPAPIAPLSNSLTSGPTVRGFPAYTYPDVKDGQVAKRAETGAERKARARLWTALCKVLAHHKQLITAQRQGDIAGLVGAVRGLCLGNEEVTLANHISKMCELAKTPSKDIPTLLAEISRLDAALSGVTDSGWKLGEKILPCFALMMFDHFEEIKTDVGLLRKLQGETLAVQRVISDLGKAHSLLPETAVGMYAGSRAGTDGRNRARGGATGTPICFDFHDTGKCRRGDRCRYTHVDGEHRSRARGSDSCYECGASDHGINACPKRKARQATFKSVTKENKELRA